MSVKCGSELAGRRSAGLTVLRSRPSPVDLSPSTSSPFARRESSRTATARGSRSGRGRTGAGTRATGRSGRSGCAARTSNFGFRLLFSIMALRAICNLSLEMVFVRQARRIPTAAACSCRSSSRPSGTACPSSLQQRERLVVAVRARDERDVHAVDRLDLVVVDLREDHLLLDAERIVATAVERPRAQSAEVADARDRDR